MGKFSRDKGRRVEYCVRNALRAQGFETDRIPLSGAAANYKGDLLAQDKDGSTFKVECKGRSGGFDMLYKLYFRDRGEDGVWRFKLPFSGPIAIGQELEKVRSHNAYFPFLDPASSHEKRSYNAIVNLRKLLGECQYLAVKKDRFNPLFICFWD